MLCPSLNSVGQGTHCTHTNKERERGESGAKSPRDILLSSWIPMRRRGGNKFWVSAAAVQLHATCFQQGRRCLLFHAALPVTIECSTHCAQCSFVVDPSAFDLIRMFHIYTLFLACKSAPFISLLSVVSFCMMLMHVFLSCYNDLFYTTSKSVEHKIFTLAWEEKPLMGFSKSVFV